MARRTLTLAKCLVGLLGSEQHVWEHAIFFSSMLYEITKVIQMKETINKEKIFQNFHKLGNLFHSGLEAFGLDVDPLFYQQASQEIFESLLTQKLKIEHNKISDESGQAKDEGGYIVRSVKDHTKDRCQLDILENLTGQNANFEAQKWTNTVG